MNSTVGPISNEKVAEKWNLWVLCTVHGMHRTDKLAEKSTNYDYCSWTVAVVPLNACAIEKKKRKKKRKKERREKKKKKEKKKRAKKHKRETQPPDPNRTLVVTINLR